MGITAHVKYEKKALQAYHVGSLLKGRLSEEYKFGDHKSVIVSTIIPLPTVITPVPAPTVTALPPMWKTKPRS